MALTPVLHIHGTADAVVPTTESTTFASIPDLYGGLGRLQRLLLHSVVTEVANTNLQDGSSVTLIQYLDCEQDAEVWHFRSTAAPLVRQHRRALLPGVRFGKTNRDFDASREIWNFFTYQPLTYATEPAVVALATITTFPIRLRVMCLLLFTFLRQERLA
ncbi:MAG: hypothetical protein H6558_18665 [Lewinellaceae bacterium]|nr:hypothetical protein [Lewinellaceae bacterium]